MTERDREGEKELITEKRDWHRKIMTEYEWITVNSKEKEGVKELITETHKDIESENKWQRNRKRMAKRETDRES